MFIFKYSSIYLLFKVCNLPGETGMCKAYKPSYFYNKNSGKCEQFIYGGLLIYHQIYIHLVNN